MVSQQGSLAVQRAVQPHGGDIHGRIEAVFFTFLDHTVPSPQIGVSQLELDGHLICHLQAVDGLGRQDLEHDNIFLGHSAVVNQVVFPTQGMPFIGKRNILRSQMCIRDRFSNEAGMGSTPHAHAQANVTDPHDQGVVAMVGVFIDTFVVLTLNALVIISTLYTADGPLAGGYVGGVTEVLDKTNLAQTAFGTVMGAGLGAKFVAICLFFFAFSTVLGWNLFGKINVIYLFGKKSPKLCTTIYTVVALIFIFLGTTMSNDLVWELTDMFNNLMVIPNAIALFALTSVVVRVARREDPDSTPLRR